MGPLSPGAVLAEGFLAGYGLSRSALARAIGISPNRVTEIVKNRRRISANTVVRLSVFFGNSAAFWMNLRTQYDLKLARHALVAEGLAQVGRAA